MAEHSKLKRLGLLSGQTLFGMVLLLLIVAAVDKSGWRADWSLSSTYSLHPGTERIIADLKQDVRIYGIWEAFPESGTRTALLLRNRAAVKEKLELIAELENQVRFEFVDSALDQPRMKALGEELGPLNPLSIYVKAANGRQIKIPYSSALDRTLENKLCSALLALEHESGVEVSILTGHGELRPGMALDDSLSLLLQQFDNNGLQYQLLDEAALSKLGRIPQDHVLFIPGPTAPLGSETTGMVRAFLDAGGNALVLADHRCPRDLSLLLRQRGIMCGNAVITGKAEHIFDDTAPARQPRIICSSEQAIIGKEGRYDRLRIVASRDYQSMPENHPVTARSFSSTILAPYCSEFYPLFPDRLQNTIPDFKQRMLKQGTRPYTIEPLLMIAGSQIWMAPLEQANVYRNQPEQQQAFLGAALTYALEEGAVVADQTARLVAFASRQLASDRIISQSRFANDLLLIDAINWLGFRENTTDIPPDSFTEMQVTCSEDTLEILFFVMVILIPLIALGLAMLTWWDRR